MSSETFDEVGNSATAFTLFGTGLNPSELMMYPKLVTSGWQNMHFSCLDISLLTLDGSVLHSGWLSVPVESSLKLECHPGIHIPLGDLVV